MTMKTPAAFILRVFFLGVGEEEKETPMVVCMF